MMKHNRVPSRKSKQQEHRYNLRGDSSTHLPYAFLRRNGEFYLSFRDFLVGGSGVSLGAYDMLAS